MSLTAWYLQNGNKTVRMPLGPCRTCVLCQNNRWCRGQDMGPQNTSYFPAAGDPMRGSVDCETGCVIQVNLIGCKVSHLFQVRGSTRSVAVQPLLASKESEWTSPTRQGSLDVHYLEYTKCKCTFADQQLAVLDFFATRAGQMRPQTPALSMPLRPCPRVLGTTMKSATFFFCSTRAKVRSSCEEGPGQSALQSAYHNPKLDVTELKQNRTSKVVQAKNCKQTN